MTEQGMAIWDDWNFQFVDVYTYFVYEQFNVPKLSLVIDKTKLRHIELFIHKVSVNIYKLKVSIISNIF